MADNPSAPEGATPPSDEQEKVASPPATPTEKKGSGARVMVMLSSVAKAPPTGNPEGNPPLIAPVKAPALAIRNPISLPKQSGTRANKITMSLAPKKGASGTTTRIPKISIPAAVEPVPKPVDSATPGNPPPLPVKTESDKWKVAQTPMSAPSVIAPDPSITAPGQKHDFQNWKKLKANVPAEGPLQSLESFKAALNPVASATPPPPLVSNTPPSPVDEPKPLGPPPPALAKKVAPAEPVVVREVKMAVPPPPLPSPKPIAAPISAPTPISTALPPPLSSGGPPSKSEPVLANKPVGSTPVLPTLASELPAKTPPPLVPSSLPSVTASPVAPAASTGVPASSPPPFMAVEPKHVVPAPLAGVIASHVAGAVPPLLVEKEKETEVTPDHKLAPPQLPPATPREEAPPLINVKAGPVTEGQPPKLPLPGGKGLKGKVLEILPPKKGGVSTPLPATAPVVGLPAKTAIAPAKTTAVSKPAAFFFAKPSKPGKLSAPVTPAPSATTAPLLLAAVATGAAAAVLAPKETVPGTAVPPVSSPIAVKKSTPPPLVPAGGPPKPAPLTRAARARRRYLIETGVFYAILILAMGALYFASLYFGRETSIEAQVIPPPTTKLATEAWIVGDFRELASGVSEDLAAERAPKLQEIQERQQHVQRARADIASREERIRLLQEQVQAARDDINATIKQARDEAQKIWDGPGADLENEYNSKLNALQKAIADRAKSLNLKYQPDDSYRSPEVWANAYRLALYQTPAGVDGVKEHQWLETQIKAWRDFTKTVDDQQAKLREQAAQIQLSPTTKVTEANTKIEDLQHRIEGLQAEEDPIKAELQEAQTDLAEAQTSEGGLDEKYYKQLYALPEPNVIKRLPIRPNGRFSWEHVERDSTFAQGENVHHYWVFVRSVRDDGRQFWSMHHFDVFKNHPNVLMIEPDAFVSTKALLRPDLTPEEQNQ